MARLNSMEELVSTNERFITKIWMGYSLSYSIGISQTRKHNGKFHFSGIFDWLSWEWNLPKEPRRRAVRSRLELRESKKTKRCKTRLFVVTNPIPDGTGQCDQESQWLETPGYKVDIGWKIRRHWLLYFFEVYLKKGLERAGFSILP